MDLSNMSVEILEEAVRDATHELYTRHRMVRPLFPHVVVMVLQKANMYKGLVALPDEQNKTIHEAIVLAVWAPFTQATGKTYQDDNGRVFSRSVLRQSQFKPGDHVLFPHWAGRPATTLASDRYRTVKECDWDIAKSGGIEAVVEYDEHDSTPLAKLAEILGNDVEGVALARRIEQQFELIDRDTQAITMSGR